MYSKRTSWAFGWQEGDLSTGMASGWALSKSYEVSPPEADGGGGGVSASLDVRNSGRAWAFRF